MFSKVVISGMRGRGRATPQQNSFMDGKTLIGPAVLPSQLCNLSHFTLPGLFYYIGGREQIGFRSLNYMEVDNNIKRVESMNTEGIYYPDVIPVYLNVKRRNYRIFRFFLLFSNE